LVILVAVLVSYIFFHFLFKEYKKKEFSQLKYQFIETDKNKVTSANRSPQSLSSTKKIKSKLLQKADSTSSPSFPGMSVITPIELDLYVEASRYFYVKTREFFQLDYPEVYGLFDKFFQMEKQNFSKRASILKAEEKGRHIVFPRPDFEVREKLAENEEEFIESIRSLLGEKGLEKFYKFKFTLLDEMEKDFDGFIEDPQMLHLICKIIPERCSDI
jgi:hypothetical protein